MLAILSQLVKSPAKGTARRSHLALVHPLLAPLLAPPDPGRAKIRGPQHTSYSCR